MKTASWVIVSATTGKAMLETWDADKAAWINANAASQARAVPIGEWLASLNAPQSSGGRKPLAELPATFPEELTAEGIQLAMFPPADPKPRKGDSTAQLALW